MAKSTSIRNPLAALVLAAWVALAATATAQLPPGFSKATVAPGGTLKNGTSLAHAPDGRVFAAEIGGTVKVLQGGIAKAVHAVGTNTDREQGLLKIEIHPRFALNGWLYLYYLTSDKHHHNIDRIALDKDSRVLESKTLVELVPLVNQGRHNGSGMAFGKDGYLYVGRGEDEQEQWAGQWTTARGKVLRFTEDGKPAPGNPHAGRGTAEEQSIWSRGHRNPWSLTLDPLSGRVFEGEVGAGWEEINDVTRPDAAKDHWYGWGGGGDGPNQGANTIKPFFAYATGSLGCAITGVAAYNAAGSGWPDKWRNRLYFTDWCGSFIRGVDIANPSASEILLSTGAAKALGLSIGADGSLYWLDHFAGSVSRISFPTAPSALRGRTGALAKTHVVRGFGGKLAMRIEGAPHTGKGILTLHGIDGSIQHRRPVDIADSRINVSWLETYATGLRAFRLEWRADGALRHVEGRILIRP